METSLTLPTETKVTSWARLDSWTPRTAVWMDGSMKDELSLAVSLSECRLRWSLSLASTGEAGSSSEV